MRKLLALGALFALLLGLVSGCSGGERPTLRVVYIADNQTFLSEAAGRENAIVNQTMFGTRSRNITWDEALEPSVIDAMEHEGTIQLTFSHQGENISIEKTDLESGQTETFGDTVITVEGGRSYRFRVTGSWESGFTTYYMEYLFELQYTQPEAPAVQTPELPIVTPTPETEETPQPSPEPSAEPSSETATPDYSRPPALTVIHDDQSITPSMGTTSWTSDNHSFEADSTHPMEWENYRTIQRIYGDNTVSLSFEVMPDQYTITVWNENLRNTDAEDHAAYYQSLLENAEEPEIDGLTITLGTGYNTGYIIMVEATWDLAPHEESGLWGGSTVFAFRVSPTNY